MILVERARCMRLFADLPKQFWIKAVNTTCFMVNQSPLALLELKTPQEGQSGKPVDYLDIYIFNCLAYVLVQEDQRTKLNAKSKPFIYLG